MPILTKEVEVRIHSNTVDYYKELGYNIPTKKSSKSYYEKTKKEFVYDFNKYITVKIEDLPIHSNIKIEVLCDECGKNISYIKYNDYTRCIEKTGTHVCRECWQKKTARTNKSKYGYEIPTKNKEIKEKIIKTNLERYGVPVYAKTQECHEKTKQTCLEKYGVEHFAQLKEIKEKRERTCIERYGVPYVAQLPDIYEKVVKSRYISGTQTSSKQQRYLNSLYGGKLNYPIKYYYADICFQNQKLVIEYDGGFHNGQVKLGSLTQEEFDQKEIVRNSVIKREGYKQMRIISRKDLLPSDTILLQMLSIVREYFNTTSHTWINFDIDNSKMINAENKDAGGVFFNYGELRRIK